MSSLTYTWTWDSDVESWYIQNRDADSTSGYDSSDGNSAGSLQTTTIGRGAGVDYPDIPECAFYQWTGTAEDLGVPAGASIDTLQVTCDYMADWSVAIGDAGFQITLQSVTNVTLDTFASVSNIEGQGTWQEKIGSAIIPTLNSDTTWKIKVWIWTASGSGKDAVQSLNIDNLAVTIGYTSSGHTITASVGDGSGEISPSGEVEVTDGANQLFEFTPDAGWMVDDVTVDTVSQGASDDYTFTNVTTDHTIAVDFALIVEWTITASAGTGGSITPSGEVSVVEGQNETFAVTAGSGYAVDEVLVDSSPVSLISGEYTFSNVIANHTIAASFEVTYDFYYTYRCFPGSDHKEDYAVKKYNKDGLVVASFVGTGAVFYENFTGIGRDDLGNIYVTDDDGRLYKLNSDLEQQWLFESTYPLTDLYVDGDGNCYATDKTLDEVVKIDTDGDEVTTGFPITDFGSVRGMTASSAGLFVIGDLGLRKYAFTGGTHTWSNGFPLDTTPMYVGCNEAGWTVVYLAMGEFTTTDNILVHNTSGVEQWTDFLSPAADTILAPYTGLLLDDSNNAYAKNSYSSGLVKWNSTGTIQYTVDSFDSYILNFLDPDGDMVVGNGTHTIDLSDGSVVLTLPECAPDATGYCMDSTITAGYRITVASLSNGKALPSDEYTSGIRTSVESSIYTVGSGGEITLNFLPDLGYVVSDVTIDSISQGALSSYTFSNVTDSVTIDVDFSGESPASEPTYLIAETSGGDLLIKLDVSGEWVWEYSEYNINCLAVDKAGYSYIGTYSGVGGTPYIRKINPVTGTPLWSYTLVDDYVYAIAVDLRGNVIAGTYNGYVKKLDSDGNLLWSTSTGEGSKIKSVIVDFNGDIYVADLDDYYKFSWEGGVALWGQSRPFLHLMDMAEDGYLYGRYHYEITRDAAFFSKMNTADGTPTDTELIEVQTNQDHGSYVSGELCLDVFRYDAQFKKLNTFPLEAYTRDKYGWIYTAGAGISGEVVKKCNPNGEVAWTYSKSGAYNYIDIAPMPGRFGAGFQSDTWTISQSVVTGSGEILPTDTSGEFEVVDGADFTFYLVPETNYYVSDVSIDGVSGEGSISEYTFDNVTSNHTIAVDFSLYVTYTITTIKDSNCKIFIPTVGEVSGETSGEFIVHELTVYEGGDQPFFIRTDPGYIINDLLIDDVSVGAKRWYPFQDITDDHTLKVTTVAGTDTNSIYHFMDGYSGETTDGIHKFNVDTQTVEWSWVWGSTSGKPILVDPNGDFYYPGGSSYITKRSGDDYSVVWQVRPNTMSYHQAHYIDPNGYIWGGPYKVRFDGTSWTTVGAATPTNFDFDGGLYAWGYETEKWDATGTLLWSQGSIYRSIGMCIDPFREYIYIATYLGAIRKLDLDGTEITTGSWPIYASGITNIAIDGLYVYAAVGTDIRKYNAETGALVWEWVADGNVQDVCVDQEGYVYGGYDENIIKISPDGSGEADWPFSYSNYIPATVQDMALTPGIYGEFWIDTIFESTITSSVTSGIGTIEPSGETTVALRGSQLYTITPDPLYVISDVQVDGTSVGTSGEYEFTDVLSNHTIAVDFIYGDVVTFMAGDGPGGTIDPSGEVIVARGADKTFWFVPDSSSYRSLEFYIDGVPQGMTPGSSYVTLTNVQNDRTLIVTFEFVEYTITASAGINGSITPSGEVVRPRGTDQEFIFTPSGEYIVDDVLVDSVSQGSIEDYTFVNIWDDHTITVSFTELVEWTITASAGVGGTITPSGEITVQDGTNKQFVFTPSGEYDVDDVLVDSVSQGAIDDYTFTNVTEAHTIAVSFALPVPSDYTIVVTPGLNGSATPTGNVDIADGGYQLIEFIPDSGYLVEYVTINGFNLGSITEFTIGPAYVNFYINIYFKEPTLYTITATAGLNGMVEPSGEVSVNDLQDQLFTFTASGEYEVDDVLVDSVSVGNVTSYLFEDIADNHTIAVSFKLFTYDIVATTDANGNITPSGETTYEVSPSGELILGFSGEAGYVADYVRVDGRYLGPMDSYTFSNVQDDHTIHYATKSEDWTLNVPHSILSGFGLFPMFMLKNNMSGFIIQSSLRVGFGLEVLQKGLLQVGMYLYHLQSLKALLSRDNSVTVEQGIISSMPQSVTTIQKNLVHVSDVASALLSVREALIRGDSIEVVQSVISDLVQSISSYQGVSASLSEIINNYQMNKLSLLRGDNVQAVQAQVSSILSELNAYQTIVMTFSDSFEAIQAVRTILLRGDAVSVIQSVIDGLQENVSAYQSNIGDLSTSLNALQSLKDSLTRGDAVEANQASINSLVEEINTYQVSILDISTSVSTLQAIRDSLLRGDSTEVIQSVFNVLVDSAEAYQANKMELSTSLEVVQSIKEALIRGDETENLQAVVYRLGIALSKVQHVSNELSTSLNVLQAKLLTISDDSVNVIQEVVNGLLSSDEIFVLQKNLMSFTDLGLTRYSVSADVYLDGRSLSSRVSSPIRIIYSEGSVHNELTFTSTDTDLYPLCDAEYRKGEVRVEAQVGNRMMQFIVDGRTGDSTNFSVTCISYSDLDDAQADDMSYTLDEPIMASTIAEDLAENCVVTWQPTDRFGNTFDWAIPIDFSFLGKPIDGIINIASSLDALVRCQDDGSLLIRNRRPIRPVDMPFATPDLYASGETILVLSHTEEKESGYNAIDVEGHQPEYQIPTMELEPFDDGSSALEGQTVWVRVYWAGLVPDVSSLYTTAGTFDLVNVGSTNQLLERTEEDVVVEFKDGKASLSYPIKNLISWEWMGYNPGDITYTVNDSELFIPDEGFGVATISYSTEYQRYIVSDHNVEKLITVIFLDVDPAVYASVMTEEEPKYGTMISAPYLTTNSGAVIRGTAWIDDNKYRKDILSLEIPYNDNAIDGKILWVDDDRIGTPGYYHIKSSTIVIDGPKVTNEVEVERCRI